MVFPPSRHRPRMTAATLKRTDGRIVQTAAAKPLSHGQTPNDEFNSDMTIDENDWQSSRVETGLVAFFDILGFTKMLSANTLEQSLNIINKHMLKELTDNKKLYGRFNMQTVV